MSNDLIKSAEELLKLNLTIPEYQRAYTWGEKNISKMIEDFEEFLKSEYHNSEYYLGTILLHNDDKVYNIIDGQQRITTLLLMLKVVESTNFKDMVYDNPKSQARIYDNYHILIKLLKNKNAIIEKIFEQIKFTVIETKNVDDAFTFFDTQNSRGIQPSVLVLLKSFNLRAISKEKFELQKECALNWENSEKHNTLKLAEKSEKLEWLIKIFFYRVRNWRSNKSADFGEYESFRDSFTKEMRESTNDKYKKYPSFTSQLAIDSYTESITRPKNSDWFEFAIRQPIYQGEGFFRFVEYYSKLLDELMNISIINDKKFRDLVEVHRVGSRFIASFLIMVTLTYYDRFKIDGLIKFIKKIDSLVSYVRLEQPRILKQTMDIQFIRCKNNLINQNILDFICGAFDSDEVNDFVQTTKALKYCDKELKKLKWSSDQIINLKNNKSSVYIKINKKVKGRFSEKHKEFWGIK